ncbi:MAG: hypothetical protein H6737_10610 [Alphaproteobacteria bacterium]|nr:hypothetical protein [Alphaproteobacteria bacterium]
MTRSLPWLALLVAGCGLSDGLTLGELDDKQREKHCEDLADFDETVLTCDEDGETLTITYGPTPVAECVADLEALPVGCIATVGDDRACVEALANATCADDLFGPTSPCAVRFDASCTPEG